MIPYSRQNIHQRDIDAVISVLKSDYLTQGETVPLFEDAIIKFCEADFAVATCNATSALHLACLALGVDNNSVVWIAATSFVASANCARYCGANIDFVDCDAESGLICINNLSEKLTLADLNNCLPDVLVVVHLAGQSCDMQRVSGLCKPYGVQIIEDACHALGGFYQHKPIGNCQYSDCAVFSFHPVKPITSAEGGMLVTSSKEIANRARLIANHGIERDQTRFENTPHGAWHYEQQVLGYNYRLSDLHAALGLSQLKRINEEREKREKLALKYNELFSGSEISPIKIAPHNISARHLYPVLFAETERRNNAFSRLRENNYGVNIHYEPIPAQPYYARMGFDLAKYPGSKAYAETVLSLPLHAFVGEDLITDIVTLCLN